MGASRPLLACRTINIYVVLVGDRSFWSGGGHFGLAMASFGVNILVVVWESHRGLLFIEFFTRSTGHELDHPTGHDLHHPTDH